MGRGEARAERRTMTLTHAFLLWIILNEIYVLGMLFRPVRA